MNPSIEVVPYHPDWPAIFEREAAAIKQALGRNCRIIHHVGSTSIPGLSAKPIIDMIPVVNDIAKVDDAADAMRRLGFEVRGEGGMLFRRFFVKSGALYGCNVHVYEAEAGELDRLLKFRDWLRTHPQDAEDYAALKVSLARQYADDRLRYTMGKEAFIVSIDKKTGYAGWRIVQALTEREWAAYHRIRKREIFDLVGITYDPQHFTLTDKSHVHLVLYLGADIVGVAHLEWLAGGEAALRPFAIDAPYQRRGLGSIFLANIERWVRQQGYHLLKLHAHPDAVGFYEQHGYSRMPFLEPDRPRDLKQVDMGKRLSG